MDNMMTDKTNRAPRNKTIALSDHEKQKYAAKLLKISAPVVSQEVIDRTIHQDIFETLDFLPEHFADLVFADPPYNMNKTFNGLRFSEKESSEYEDWLDSWVSKLSRILKPTGSIYICGDWRSSAAIHRVMEKYFVVRNRITWEREKGRGAKTNWKNCSEDIWFCTVSEKYTFNVEDVKLRRKVIAPYTTEDGAPKDWEDTEAGRYRLTYPSNIWTDLTVPFWSMSENTDHPTQKPEKLLAKIILASSNREDIVFDPFLGSGTTSVVAKKLARHYVGVEIDPTYCCLTEKRLEVVDNDNSIQGYHDGYFWERNTLAEQNGSNNEKASSYQAVPLLSLEEHL
jgi:site-specific DNA-methyltransferase (adenine-specific)